jgi:hypothetical protein
LVVTASPSAEGALPAAGDGTRRSPGADVVAQALDGLPPANLAPPLPTTLDLAPPLLDGQATADELAGALLTVPLAPETEWFRTVAAIRPGSDQAKDGRDALFAQLGNQDGFLELLGGDPGEAWE